MVLDFEMTEKLGGFAARLAQGAPKGLGLGVKFLIGASAAVYGVYKSMYTGKIHLSWSKSTILSFRFRFF